MNLLMLKCSLQYTHKGFPWPHNVPVLKCEYPAQLIQVCTIMRYPGCQQLAECNLAKYRMNACLLQLRGIRIGLFQYRNILASQHGEFINQLIKIFSFAFFKMSKSVEWNKMFIAIA